MASFVIRNGEPKDLPAIADLQSQTPEAAVWPVEDYLTYQLDLAFEDGALAGFLVTRRLIDGEAEVLNIAVHPNHRRRGVARKLLAQALERWPGEWFLEVRASNLGAQACYASMGFRSVGKRMGYYSTENGNSREEGIVMQKGK